MKWYWQYFPVTIYRASKHVIETGLATTSEMLFFELGTQLGLPVAFTELKREGPLHNATFSFKVTVGDFTGVGEGRSIPLAKSAAPASPRECPEATERQKERPGSLQGCTCFQQG
uniref:DRBM domain-containing protein n=1 Tax=Periophthalmus magnuspinnatus TaxID=409849 RepID=A0A3B4ASS5_9GOBI